MFAGSLYTRSPNREFTPLHPTPPHPTATLLHSPLLTSPRIRVRPLYSDRRQMLDFLPLYCVITPRTHRPQFFIFFKCFFSLSCSRLRSSIVALLFTILSSAVTAGSIFVSIPSFVCFLCFVRGRRGVWKDGKNKCDSWLAIVIRAASTSAGAYTHIRAHSHSVWPCHTEAA